MADDELAARLIENSINSTRTLPCGCRVSVGLPLPFRPDWTPVLDADWRCLEHEKNPPIVNTYEDRTWKWSTKECRWCVDDNGNFISPETVTREASVKLVGGSPLHQKIRSFIK